MLNNAIHKAMVPNNKKTITGMVVAGVAVVSLLVSSFVSAVVVQAAPPTNLAVQVDRILLDTNKIRTDRGLAPLKLSLALSNMSQEWSEVQASTRSMHHNPNYVSQTPAGWNSVAENVASGWSYTNVVTAWQASPGHLANMTSASFTHIGIGVALDSQGFPYTTQNFAGYAPNINPDDGFVPPELEEPEEPQPGDDSYVNAPAVTVASLGYEDVTVTWNAVGFSGTLNPYRVVITNQETGVVVKDTTTTGLSFTESNLADGVNYKATITASVIATNGSTLTQSGERLFRTMKMNAPTITAPTITINASSSTAANVRINTPSTMGNTYGKPSSITYELHSALNGQPNGLVGTFNANGVINLTGLQPGTTHNYFVQAIGNTRGIQAVSTLVPANITLNAPTDSIPVTPSKPYPKKLSAESVVLRWVASPDSVGTVRYKIEWQNTHPSFAEIDKGEQFSRIPETTITGLRDNSNYNIFVSTVTTGVESGYESTSEPLEYNIVTPKSTSSLNSISGIGFQEVRSGGSYIEASWSEHSRLRGRIVEQTLVVIAPDGSTIQTHDILGESKPNEITINSLSRGTQYTIQVKTTVQSLNKRYTDSFTSDTRIRTK